MRNFKPSESGSVAIEYSLIAGMIALAIFGVIKLTSPSVEKPFTEINDKIKN